MTDQPKLTKKEQARAARDLRRMAFTMGMRNAGIRPLEEVKAYIITHRDQ